MKTKNLPKPRKEFGMFGLDFLATRRIANRLLKPYGLKLRTHTNYAKWGNQSEVWLEDSLPPGDYPRTIGECKQLISKLDLNLFKQGLERDELREALEELLALTEKRLPATVERANKGDDNAISKARIAIAKTEKKQ